MQGDWGNDNDWQLKKLQHDSLKTAEKVVETLRETIEREVLALGKDYERLFGPRSAQFTEYLTMVTQKLEQHGVAHTEVLKWLQSAASEGSVPRDHFSDLRDSQSKTVPFIDGGPMHDFGEQSLMDRSLGNGGASSQRPHASPAAMTTFEFEMHERPGYNGQGNGNGQAYGNGNGHNGYAQPAQNAFQAPPPPPVPVPVPMPVSVAVAMPQPFQAQPAPSPPPPPSPSPPPPPTPPPAPPVYQNIPAAQNMQVQPNYGMSAPIPGAFPMPQPAVPAAVQGQFPQHQQQVPEAKEDDKYVFDPFTAWD